MPPLPFPSLPYTREMDGPSLPFSTATRGPLQVAPVAPVNARPWRGPRRRGVPLCWRCRKRVATFRPTLEASMSERERMMGRNVEWGVGGRIFVPGRDWSSSGRRQSKRERRPAAGSSVGNKAVGRRVRAPGYKQQQQQQQLKVLLCFPTRFLRFERREPPSVSLHLSMHPRQQAAAGCDPVRGRSQGAGQG